MISFGCQSCFFKQFFIIFALKRVDPEREILLHSAPFDFGSEEKLLNKMN
jgi:hypothetical protein